VCETNIHKRKFQEGVHRPEFSRGLNLNGGPRRLKAFEKALGMTLSILIYLKKAKETRNPHLFNKLNCIPWEVSFQVIFSRSAQDR
jgi:hypothetical protein